MAKLARALRTDSLADVDLRQLAQMLRKKGRGRDTVLAHITPQEAKLLKRRGGRGSINPKTGLPEFEDDFDFGGDFGGDYGGGGTVYEYYDEPAPDAQGFYEQPFATEQVPGGEQPAAADPNVQLLSATELNPEQQAQDARRAADIAAIGQGGAVTTPFPTDGDGNPIVPRDPSEAGAAIAQQAFDARNAETARIAGLEDTDPERMRYEADIATRATQEPDFLSRLGNSLGLGNLGLGNLTSGLGAAGLMRLLAAGGAGATALRAGNAAQADAVAARNDINAVAADARQAGNVAQTDLTKLADNTRNVGNTAVADINKLADTANLRAVDIQKGLASIAGNAGARAAEVQAQYNALASPYQTQGRELAQMGLSGGLTPASARAYQAAEARLAQQGIGRGGVAAAQAATQLEGLRAQLLGDEYKQGLDTQQIGDRYASQGIAAGLAQSNLSDVLNANALNTGLAQYNYANTLSTGAITAGMTANDKANALSSAGITAALNAAGISDGYLIQGINTYINGNKEARTAMQGFWSSIGNFLGGGTGNTTTTTTRSA